MSDNGNNMDVLVRRTSWGQLIYLTVTAFLILGFALSSIIGLVYTGHYIHSEAVKQVAMAAITAGHEHDARHAMPMEESGSTPSVTIEQIKVALAKRDDKLAERVKVLGDVVEDVNQRLVRVEDKITKTGGSGKKVEALLNRKLSSMEKAITARFDDKFNSLRLSPTGSSKEVMKALREMSLARKREMSDLNATIMAIMAAQRELEAIHMGDLLPKPVDKLSYHEKKLKLYMIAQGYVDEYEKKNPSTARTWQKHWNIMKEGRNNVNALANDELIGQMLKMRSKKDHIPPDLIYRTCKVFLLYKNDMRLQMPDRINALIKGNDSKSIAAYTGIINTLRPR